MELIVIRKNKGSATSSGDGLLWFAVSNEPIASIIVDGLTKNLCLPGDSNAVIAIPEEQGIQSCVTAPNIVHYQENVPICIEDFWKTKRKRTVNSWLVISDGRFATQINSELLYDVLASAQTDVLAVNVEPELLAHREKVRLTAHCKIAGFRRLYSDSTEPAPSPTDWPHHVFIKTNVLDKAFANSILPCSFSDFIKRCLSNALKLRAINVGGGVLDLETEDGLLNFCKTRLDSSPYIRSYRSNRDTQGGTRIVHSSTVSQSSRLVGKVLLGENVRIGPKVVIVGPTIIGDNVRIEQAAAINSSIIGPGVCVPRNQLVQNRVVKGPQCNWKRLTHSTSNNSKQICYPTFGLSRQPRRFPVGDLFAKRQPRVNDTFRDWPRFSYARCFKRLADFVAAIVVLILFAPIMPFVTLAIRLTSQGPVFFKDKRQGLHGKAFNCVKFRTMIVGADKMQDKLRIVSQVDGPQFKMADDPRLSAVGRFLRETYIDEVPQFFNVLLGQMSVVGPRPSPESENTLCPPWRDARLSVRPGITGLWQIFRTRQPMKDFQEWIHYDIKYVRDISPRMDLSICWQTTKELVKNFVSRF